MKALELHIVRERERIELNRLPRSERFAKRGQIDLYVASTAANKLKADDDRLWLPAFDLGVTTAARAELKGDRLPQGPAWVKHFPTYKKNLLGNKMIRTDGIFTRGKKEYFMIRAAIMAAGVDEPQSIEGLIVSRGNVLVRDDANRSLILAMGDVELRAMVKGAIICDGDVVMKGMHGSFIIARGNVTVEGYGSENTIIAGGTVVFKKPVPLPNQQTIPKERENRIQEKVKRPLGYITFFELSTVGVEVKVEGKSLQVTTIADDKPFADAGREEGDIMMEVNGKKPDSAESLRRLFATPWPSATRPFSSTARREDGDGEGGAAGVDWCRRSGRGLGRPDDLPTRHQSSGLEDSTRPTNPGKVHHGANLTNDTFSSIITVEDGLPKNPVSLGTGEH